MIENEKARPDTRPMSPVIGRGQKWGWARVVGKGGDCDVAWWGRVAQKSLVQPISFYPKFRVINIIPATYGVA